MTIFRNFKNQSQRKNFKEFKKNFNEFPETAEFVDDRPEQKCSKENISVEEVIFLFTCLEAKS